MRKSAFLLFAALTLFAASTAVNAATYFTGTFNSAQEVPTNSSTAAGFGRVVLSDDETQITYSITFSGLSSNQTASHIHNAAPPGSNASVLLNIGSTGATSGTFTNLTSAVTPAQVANLKAGLLYFNVHSANFPGGEIRGQITADSPFVAVLNNNQEVPVNASTATGRGNVSLNATGTQIIMSLTFSGLSSNQVASHIHNAARPGVNASVLFNIGSTGMTSGTFTDLFFNVTPAQAASLKSGQLYFNVHSANLPGGEIRGQILRRRSTTLDYDGDSKTDLIIARQNTGANSTEWYIQNSTGGTASFPFGASSDFAAAQRLLAGDFDGDGKDDITIWRTGAAGVAAFYILQSATNTVRSETFGQTGDDPRVIADYDGDGRTDLAVYRDGTSTATQSFWFYRASANNPAGNINYVPWGTDGDFANPGDYDGDGRADFCQQRGFGGTTGGFWCLRADGSTSIFQFGNSSDFTAPGDYDGDGKTDIAAVRTVGSQRNWFIRKSLDSGVIYNNPWGTTTSVRAQGDYDGDGKTDVAVWQAASTTAGTQAYYWVLPSNGDQFTIRGWGVVGDVSVNGYNIR